MAALGNSGYNESGGGIERGSDFTGHDERRIAGAALW
jgi:hypothetical protein